MVLQGVWSKYRQQAEWVECFEQPVWMKYYQSLQMLAFAVDGRSIFLGGGAVVITEACHKCRLLRNLKSAKIEFTCRCF